LRSVFNDLGEEFPVPRQVRMDNFMMNACILPDTQGEIESATIRPVRALPAGIAHIHCPTQMMESLPHCHN
jgi:hypothetical protein